MNKAFLFTIYLILFLNFSMPNGVQLNKFEEIYLQKVTITTNLMKNLSFKS